MSSFEHLLLEKLMTRDGRRTADPAKDRQTIYRAFRKDTELVYLWLLEAHTVDDPFTFRIFETYLADLIFLFHALEQLEVVECENDCKTLREQQKR